MKNKIEDDKTTKGVSDLDKEINRFIVIYVEQYASGVNQSSKSVYNRLKQSGIIDELIEDYEDMHGM